MNYSLKSLIVTHICYRSMFKAPLKKDSLIRFLGIDEGGLDEFQRSIEELKSEGLVEEKNGYLVASGNTDAITNQEEKDARTEDLKIKSSKFLSFFSKIPFVKFIGISGSIAANNPVVDKNGLNEGRVDMDLFVICETNTMWMLFLCERIVTNIHRLIFRHYFYCFNYVTDQSFLEIHNKNFYTATEINNLIPVYDNNIYGNFLKANSWYNKYYHRRKEEHSPIDEVETSFFQKLLLPVNHFFFIMFCIGRALKRLEIAPIFEISMKFNPANKCNLRRISEGNGGYQEAIKKRFEQLFKADFPEYYDEELMLDLFPKQGSFIFKDVKYGNPEMTFFFEKYLN